MGFSLIYFVMNCSLIDHCNLECIAKWMYEHPTIVKTIEYAGLILGLGLMYSALSGMTAVFSAEIINAELIGGTLLALVSGLALYALDILIPPHHDMSIHAFEPGECEGGKLYYEGDIPILSLDYTDPFAAGKAHGYLCGDAISKLLKRHQLVDWCLGLNDRHIPNIIGKLKQIIPPNYLQEIEGIVEGYNNWSKEQYWWQFPAKITLDEMLLNQLLADMVHINPSVSDLEHVFACSAIVQHIPSQGPVFARNMDWPALGLYGTYSLMIHRKSGQNQTIEVGVPGCAGTVTGMNQAGLSLAMNVCSGNTEQFKGMPAMFYNRLCLEQCQDVQDVRAFVQNNDPLGPYHLTAVDENEAASFHFFQSPKKTHVIRDLDEDPLVTLNYRYDPIPICDMHCSSKRSQEISKYMKQNQTPDLKEALKLPYVNNWLTTHAVLMEPGSLTMQVNFDNAFAAAGPMHLVPVRKIFGQD